MNVLPPNIKLGALFELFDADHRYNCDVVGKLTVVIVYSVVVKSDDGGLQYNSTSSLACLICC